MEKCLIFGNKDLAELVFETIIQDDADKYDILGFVVDDAYYNEEDKCCGEHVYRYSEISSCFDKAEIGIIVCVGYTNMNSGREAVFKKLKQDGWKISEYVNRYAIVRAIEWGEGNIVLDGVNIGVKTKVGNGNIFGPGTLWGHHSEMKDYNFFSAAVSVAGHVRLGSRCFCGNNCTIKDKIVIADKTVVGAGCYLNHNVTKTDTVWASQGCVKLPSELQRLL